MPPHSSRALELDADAITALHEWDLAVRAELSGDPPSIDLEAARWAAQQFLKACQFLADRDVKESVVRDKLEQKCPSPRCPQTDYSVDLLFCFLPDLLTLARRLALDDALTGILEQWAREWPLSSTGVLLPPATTLQSFIRHPALRRLYLDRVITLVAKDRLGDPSVGLWLHAELCVYPEIAPLVSEALKSVPHFPTAQSSTPRLHSL